MAREAWAEGSRARKTYHSRRVYVTPATTSIRLHPARKTGRHANASSIESCLMHALSSQHVGPRPCAASKRAAHASSAAYFCPGAASSSRQLWERKASTSPRGAASVFFASSKALVPGLELGVADEPWVVTPEPARSSLVSRATGIMRKSEMALTRIADGSPPPQSPATAAARCCSFPCLPRAPSQRTTRPRLARVGASAQVKLIVQKITEYQSEFRPARVSKTS